MTAPEGDKRWTTILSTDMVGFTQISAKIGSEKVYDLLHHVLADARDAIEAHGGYVIDTAGDGILAAFGAPNALENAPLQGCRAAVAFRTKIAAQLDDLEKRFGVTPQFRTGISGGNAMVAHLDDDVIKVVGEPVNAASRLQSLAEPDAILLSEDIRREVEGVVQTSDRGPTMIKGFADPIHVHQLENLVETVTKFDGNRRRGIVNLVSRQTELKLALDVLSPEAPQIVVISGPPGIGKSRLAHEITVALPANRPTYIGQCAPTGQTPAYGPVLDILRQAGRAPIGANRQTALAAVFARHPELEDAKAGKRFTAPTEQQLDQTERVLADRAFLLALLRNLSAAESCVFVIEDAHWIDTATNGLLSAINAAPVPLVVTCRPEFRADWFEKDLTTKLDLQPLSETDIRRIVEANLNSPISSHLSEMISEKAEGNPLMAEEVTRALRQSGRLLDGAEGLDVSKADGPLLTGNLEQLVLARVDKLGAAQKTALQYASAVGRDFSADVLSASLGQAADLVGISETPGLIDSGDEGQWRFTHALIRDAVYGSLLSGQRQTAHLKIAKAIKASEGRYADNWALLAEHYLQSSEPEKSVPFLVRAAEQSLSVYALYDVDHRLEQAMGFLDTDPDLVDEDTFRSLAVSWLRALDQIGDFGRVQRVAARVLPRLERAGYTPSLSIARTLTSIAMTHSRDYRSAEELALTTLADAEAQADERGAAWAKVALMRTYEETAWQGLETLERLAAEIQPVAEETRDHHMAMSALYLLSSSHRSVGSHRMALSVAEQIEEFSTKYNDRRAKAYAHWSRALVFIVQGDPEGAYQAILPSLDNIIPGGADDRVATGILRFCEIFMLPADQVRPQINQLIDETRSLRDFNLVHALEWARAVLEFRAGNLALGWRLHNTFLEDVEKTQNMPLLRQGYMTRAEITLSMIGLIDPASEAPPERPKPDRKPPGLADILTFVQMKFRARSKAERDLRRALSLSKSPLGPYVARCHIGLGLIAASRKRNTEAREHLERGLKTIEGEDFAIIENRAQQALAKLS